MEKPEKCPICGGKVRKVINAVTKNSYYKCTNEGCHFVLGEDYTEAELYLQGQPLQSRCIKCKENLTIANGPHGLYPRCYHCNCDLQPTMYNGRMYQKWVNAHREHAKEEVGALIKSFNSSKNEEDALYDFDAYIAEEKPVKKEVKKKVAKKATTGSTIGEAVLNYLMNNSNKPTGAEELHEATKMKVNSIRTSLLNLKTLGLVKVVGYTRNYTGNHTLLYQTTKSYLPEIKGYSKEDGYNTVSSFLKENVDKYGSIVRSKEILTRELRESKIEPVLFYSTRGVCDGYKEKDMIEALQDFIKEEKVSSNIKSNSKVKPKRDTKYSGAPEKITELLSKDLNKSWTGTQLSEVLDIHKNTVIKYLERMLASKTIKIVELKEVGQSAAYIPCYQLAKSELPKVKIVKDLKTYSTIYSYYYNKLRGKRIIFTNEIYARMKNSNLESVCIAMGRNRYYKGYAIADLKRIVNEVLEEKKNKSTTKPKITKIPVEIEASLISTQENQKKSIFSTITSFFNKKKKRGILSEQTVSSN